MSLMSRLGCAQRVALFHSRCKRGYLRRMKDSEMRALLQGMEVRLGNKLQDVELRFEKKLQVLDTRIEAVGDEAKLARAESRQMGVELRAHIDWHISHLRDTIAGRFEVFDAR